MNPSELTEEQKCELYDLHVSGVQITKQVVAIGAATPEEEHSAALDYIEHFQEKFGEHEPA